MMRRQPHGVDLVEMPFEVALDRRFMSAMKITAIPDSMKTMSESLSQRCGIAGTISR
jgi:hypothetical protein